MVRAGALVVASALALLAGPTAGAGGGYAPLTARQVIVPSVVGMTRAHAEHRLRALGLRLAVVTAGSGGAAGTVVAQRPRARARVARGATVRLTVAAAGQVAVPDVVGLQREAAEDRLSSAGLEPRVVLVYSLLLVGSVVDQDPGAGRLAAAGTAVTISVSRGPGP